MLSVSDINDQIPVITSPSGSEGQVGFPTNAGLQAVLGPVITIQVRAWSCYNAKSCLCFMSLPFVTLCYIQLHSLRGEVQPPILNGKIIFQ